MTEQFTMNPKAWREGYMPDAIYIATKEAVTIDPDKLDVKLPVWGVSERMMGRSFIFFDEENRFATYRVKSVDHVGKTIYARKTQGIITAPVVLPKNFVFELPLETIELK